MLPAVEVGDVVVTTMPCGVADDVVLVDGVALLHAAKGFTSVLSCQLPAASCQLKHFNAYFCSFSTPLPRNPGGMCQRSCMPPGWHCTYASLLCHHHVPLHWLPMHLNARPCVTLPAACAALVSCTSVPLQCVVVIVFDPIRPSCCSQYSTFGMPQLM